MIFGKKFSVVFLFLILFSFSSFSMTHQQQNYLIKLAQTQPQAMEPTLSRLEGETIVASDVLKRIVPFLEYGRRLEDRNSPEAVSIRSKAESILTQSAFFISEEGQSMLIRVAARRFQDSAKRAVRILTMLMDANLLYRGTQSAFIDEIRNFRDFDNENHLVVRDREATLLALASRAQRYARSRGLERRHLQIRLEMQERTGKSTVQPGAAELALIRLFAADSDSFFELFDCDNKIGLR